MLSTIQNVVIITRNNFLSNYLSIYLFIYLSIYPSICLYHCFPFYLSYHYSLPSQSSISLFHSVFVPFSRELSTHYQQALGLHPLHTNCNKSDKISPTKSKNYLISLWVHSIFLYVHCISLSKQLPINRCKGPSSV